MSSRLLSHKDLAAKGILLGKVQIWRLEKEGKFPKHVNPSAGRNAWIEGEIDAYIAGRIGLRNAAPVAA